MKNRMFNLLLVLIVLSLFSVSAYPQDKKGIPKASKKGTTCSTCHPDIYAVLPKNHKKVSKNDISACIQCHKPDKSAKIEPKAYVSILHRSHIKQNITDCSMCHTYRANQFGLHGYKVSYGKLSREDFERIKEIFISWSTSKNTDAIHGKADILCSACHGKHLPVTGDDVENITCLNCHGPLETLKKQSEPKDFPDRNPHNSHLGDIACTVCHKAHKPSVVYCLGCHGNFKMKIPGEE